MTEYALTYAEAKSRPVSDEEYAKLDAEWNRAFAGLRAAGLESDADHPIAAAYRSASNAVNHANRSRDFAIATGLLPSQIDSSGGTP